MSRTETSLMPTVVVGDGAVWLEVHREGKAGATTVVRLFAPEARTLGKQLLEAADTVKPGFGFYPDRGGRL